jgi:hypothetical protein
MFLDFARQFIGRIGVMNGKEHNCQVNCSLSQFGGCFGANLGDRPAGFGIGRQSGRKRHGTLREKTAFRKRKATPS